MFPQQPQQQFRNSGANVQIFYKDSTWTKPPGVSTIYMLLIGGGGTNNGTSGGGSGAVTTWMGAAINVPNNLVLSVSTGSAVNTTVNYRGSNGINALLTANAAVNITRGAAMSPNQFSASGFFQSVAGENGQNGAVNLSSTTFLSAGAGTNNSVTANYGYSLANSAGFFMLQPVILGVGGSGATVGGIGCGAGGGGGSGGPGLILIASM